MKKALFFLPFLMLTYLFANAQWSTTPPNTTFTYSGNVGIGVSVPSVLLEVAGSGGSSIKIGPSSISTWGAIQFNNGAFNSANHNFAGGNDNALYINRPSGAIIHFREANGADQMTIASGGNVGVGVTNPGTSLEVKGSGTNTTIKIGPSSISTWGAIQFNNSAFTSANHNFAGGNDNALYINRPSGAVIHFREANGVDQLTIQTGGKVGIGTANPDQLLSVKGIIHSQEVLIDLTGWSDYVFNKDYKLPSLNEVQSYIKKNHHLPEVPSADEMEESGLKVGEMNKLLMKKVEKLTLYLIEQNKRIDQLEEQLKHKQQ